MSSSSSSALTPHLGSQDNNGRKSWTVVEMPCIVRSTPQALQMIGGEDHVLKDLKKAESDLKCRLPTTSPVGSVLHCSTTTTSPGLIVKLRRKKTETRQPSGVTAQVVGVVGKKIKFDNCADYQFLPQSTCLDDYPARSSISTSGVKESGLPVEEDNGQPILEVLPESFLTRTDEKSRRSGLLKQFLYTSRRMQENFKRKVSEDSEIQSERETTEELSVVYSESAAAEGTAGSAVQNAKRARNRPDFSFSMKTKLGDEIPSGHTLGPHPPHWAEKINYRGFEMLEKLQQIFALIPSKSTYPVTCTVSELSRDCFTMNVNAHSSVAATTGGHSRHRQKSSFI